MKNEECFAMRAMPTYVPEGGQHRERRGDPCGRPPEGHAKRTCVASFARPASPQATMFIPKKTCQKNNLSRNTCRRNNDSTGGYNDFDRRIFKKTGSPAATQGGYRRNTCPPGMSVGPVLYMFSRRVGATLVVARTVPHRGMAYPRVRATTRVAPTPRYMLVPLGDETL